MRVRVLTVAKKDFKDAIRSRTIWALIGLYVLGSVTWTYSIAWRFSRRVTSQGGDPTLAFLVTMIIPVAGFVPLTGMAISAKSVVNERELGTINYLMSLPFTRADVLLGKYFGRTAVLVLGIVTGFLASAIVFSFEVAVVDPTQFLLFFLLTVLLGMVFVSLGLGLSASVSSTTRAVVLAGGLVLLVGPIWPSVLGLLPEDWSNEVFYVFLERLHLEDVFTDAFFFVVETSDETAMQTTAKSLPDGVEMAFYFRNWFAFVILALWIVVPILIGYLRFVNAEF